MKSIPKKNYVLLAITTVFLAFFGLFITFGEDDPGFMKEFPTEEKVIKAERFSFETASYSSHSEVCSAKKALDEYAEDYKIRMKEREESESATMRTFNKEYKKYDKIKNELISQEAEFTPTDEEKLKIKEEFFYSMAKEQEDKEELIKAYEEGVISIDRAIDEAGFNQVLDELYESDYDIFCSLLSGYDMLGWYKTPSGSGYDPERPSDSASAVSALPEEI